MNDKLMEIVCVNQCKLPLPIPFKDNPITNQSPCHSCIFTKPCQLCNKANLYDLFEPAQTETSKRAATYKPRRVTKYDTSVKAS